MVSSTKAVFPICLSPMINSLCPRPIGIAASITLIPVAKGVFTDSLSITEGAGLSIGKRSFVAILPLPSKGSPKGFTTLPNNDSPTGTESTEPVLFTISPSWIAVSSPSTTAPTVYSSKFNTIAGIDGVFASAGNL